MTESFYHLPDAHRHVINDGCVVSCSLVIHAPSSSYKLQSPFIDKPLDYILHGAGLLAPPSPEESRLNIDKSSLLIKQQGLARAYVGLKDLF